MIQSIDKSSRYLLLVAENSLFHSKDIDDSLMLVGAIFPRLVFDDNSYDSGFILAKMNDNTSAFVVEDMSKNFDTNDLGRLNSFFIVVDGLSSHIGNFIECFFENANEKSKIIGGGAGKLTLQQEPIIFSNHGIFKDSALIIGSYDPIGIGVQHGWEEIKGPYIATNTDRCILNKINYIDAFELYKKVVEEDSGVTFNDENFFDIAKGYPFGITRYSREVVVRDPITTDGKSMTLVGEMDTNSVISILKGDSKNLVEAAKDASQKSIDNLKVKKAEQALLIDCISRFLFLDDNFNEELLNIKSSFDSDALVWGILSLGEIANANQENIEFYNKTCVVGAL